ncbi:hypothetical protein Rsub_10016 [Raphidocelis subcapitata]|uniref:Uncharacterized protein n=1 Tax=Raphidocelis subcapitata TaxID=307507 RepID=A0A2V0PJV5_9CHLO|nr:hypothetical protein Rsub_10016 [Raphidocelis subcapitata]|eukprot:GBF97325.1 hypothetical protein Rsub_10016 [Raphidocelis subcapitata]
MSLARTGRLLGRAWQQAAAGGAAQAAAQQQHGGAAAGALRAQLGAQARAFGAHAGGEGVTYAGLTLKKAPFWEYASSKAIGGFMWFWVFYMMYNNWEHKMYGLPYLFEKEGLDDDDEGHGHH